MNPRVRAEKRGPAVGPLPFGLSTGGSFDETDRLVTFLFDDG